MTDFRPLAIKYSLAIILIAFTCQPVIAKDAPWKAMEAVYLLLRDQPGPGVIEGIDEPIYQDAANIPQLAPGVFGAMGEHPVRILSINNPGYADEIVNKKAGNAPDDYYSNSDQSIRLKVDLFFPADLNTARPTVFFIAGYRLYASETYYNILYFIASHGYNCVYVSYEEQRAGNTNHIKDILTQVVSDPLFSSRIDTSKVGYMGHSLAGGLLLNLANDLSNWGTDGRFIFTMAGWIAYFNPTKPYPIPPGTSLIVQTYNEELNDRPNDFDTDARFSIDYLTNTAIDNSEKTYLYLPGNGDHPSNHSTPKSKYNLQGNKHFYYDALQQVGIFRPLKSIMRYAFNIDTANKAIGLPDSNAAIRTYNSIDFYSGDNPYVDIGMLENPFYDSTEYAYQYNQVTIASSKVLYSAAEAVTIHLEKMAGNANDWVGIFPAGVAHEWENQVAWLHTGGFTSGSLTFDDSDTIHGDFPFAAGDYEAGAFFNDSLDALEAKVNFTVAE